MQEPDFSPTTLLEKRKVGKSATFQELVHSKRMFAPWDMA
jgi:hypothetical protein